MAKKHKTFFGKLFGGLWDILKSSFNSADHPLLEIAIKITNKVKDFLNSGIVDVITSIIPTDIDNQIVDLLRAKLPLILADELALKTLQDPGVDPEAVARQLLDSFGGLSDEKKAKFYTSVAAQIYIFINEHKNGEKITFGQAAAFVETAYQAWQASKGTNERSDEHTKGKYPASQTQA